MHIKKKRFPVDVNIPLSSGAAPRLAEQSGNRPSDGEDSLRMSDEGCPNEGTPSVPDATGYS
ncbi:MAG TPA: hypothetical protein VK699_11305 [Terriglobales bacterium]|jgi:hypothetical protein|nr:hypothetical protein [Terriglobales bacterium]